MVSPVTGPIVQTVGGSGEVTSFLHKESWKQAKPIDRPLPYEMRRGSATLTGTYFPVAYNGRTLAAGFNMIDQVETWHSWTPLVNIAYDKLKDKIADRAEMGVAFAEVGQSYRMIAARATQLRVFVNQLRRGNFVGAAKTLKMPGPPKGVSAKKSFANNYLEFHFGWSPLVGDLYSAVDVLQNPIKDVHVRASSKEKARRYDLTPPSSGSNPGAWWPALTSWKSWRYWEGRRVVAMGADVHVSNPNLWLANQMGLVNPLAVAWELVPYSFVVDWFVNVGQVVSSMTDFYGLTLTGGWTTYSYKGNASYFNSSTYRWVENGQIVAGGRWQKAEGPFVHTRRSLGITGPALAVRPWKAWKWRRTAAAVSLLVQRLPGR